ncbi:TPA: hypothetical protein DCL89_01615 [candidate division WWE3 bacterium]|nr:hypothetical protein [candidate division WWE3 bacterium]
MKKLLKILLVILVTLIAVYLALVIFIRIYPRIAPLICQVRGGEYSFYGWSVGGICIVSYKDGGRLCTNSKECKGGCIITTTGQTTGKCKEDNSPIVCSKETLIENRRISPAKFCPMF